MGVRGGLWQGVRLNRERQGHEGGQESGEVGRQRGRKVERKGWKIEMQEDRKARIQRGREIEARI